ncbi:Hypothetical predicted protein [Octopus vulgaris]|nr:Hypothetical predicted protein [Octopus vulgaris]
MSEQFPQVATKVNSLQPDDLPDKLKSAVTEDRNRDLNIMQVSLDLLSENLKKYFENALQQLWPFMPPTIVPDMMFEKNHFIPKLCQADLLLTALNYAIECGEFHYASALAFVVDRFMYWYGGSKVLLNIIDHILVLSPSTVIAPQLTIRRARIMKDNGNLHGAIEVLDSLIDSKGLWKEAVPLLLKSVEEFEKLPDKDLKGISYSYGLLSHCLCKLSHKEYLELQNIYVFQRDHPCYEAFEYGMKAAELSPKQSLFFARHCLQSSESLLMYAVQNIWFSYPKAEAFYLPQWKWSRIVFAMYRVSLAFYTMACLLDYVIVMSHGSSPVSHNIMAYMTTWTYSLLVLHFNMAAVITLFCMWKEKRGTNRVIDTVKPTSIRRLTLPSGLYDQKSFNPDIYFHGKSELEAGFQVDMKANFRVEADRSTWYMKLSWLVFSVVFNWAIIVTLIFFGAIYPGFIQNEPCPVISFEDINIHALNTVFVILELKRQLLFIPTTP